MNPDLSPRRSPDELIFLGTGDSMGVPRVYCDCDVCLEARTTGENRRFRLSVLLRAGGEEALIDVGPDWTAQMERFGRRRIGTVLITHGHFDHIGGLPEWADACRWTGERGRLYAPAEVLPVLRRQFPWLEQYLTYSENDGGMQWAGWRIAPFRVNHGKNGYAYAYLFEKTAFRWVYCSDAIALTEEQKAARMRKLDLLVLGTNFYRKTAEFHTRSVYDMTEAVELLAELQPKRTVFTHLSHGVDVRERYPLPASVTLARTGLRLALA